MHGSRFSLGIAGLILILILGYGTASSHDETRRPFHFSGIDISQTDGFKGLITSHAFESEKYFRYRFEVTRLISQDTTLMAAGGIHLYIRRDSSTEKLNYGDHLYINGKIGKIPSPKNPEEFDYSIYISKQNIFGQAFIDGVAYKRLKNLPPSLVLDFAYEVRRQCSKIISDAIPSILERQIALAIVLGERDYLESKVKKAYASAGAIHVLAISGLHVGIIYMIMVTLLRPFKKYLGVIPLVILIISVLWLYALIAGFSPSVLRAATMFTVIALKDLGNRRSNVYNSLGIAAIVLLLIDPNFIYSVGFQLSFAAVFGILYFQPKIYRLLKFEYWIFDKIWSISCISLAAQLSTFPLTIYYFHQFPVYFLISNLFVIPGAMIIMVSVIPLLVFSFLPIAKMFFGKILATTIYVINEGVFWIEKLPFSLIEWLHIDFIQLILVYIVIIFLFGAWQYKSFISMTIALLGLLGLIIQNHLVIRHFGKYRALLVYEIREKTTIDLVENGNGTLLINEFDSTDLELLGFQINPFRRASRLNPIAEGITEFASSTVSKSFGPLRLLAWNGLKIGILNKRVENFELNKPLEMDILIVSNNSVKNLQEISRDLKTEHLIISSENSYWNTRNLEIESNERGIPLHSISRDGYWRLDLN